MMKRTQKEIDDQINKANEGRDNGSKYPGMSYEDGVIEALDWVTGAHDDPPMPEDG